MDVDVGSSERSAYYTAALQLLRFVEARAPSNRRFGADADALWEGFAGGLKTSDRIDILLRVADAAWPGAFGARATFGLRAVAEDDPFGASWASLEPMDGEKLWRENMRGEAPGSREAVVEVLERAWSVRSAETPVPAIGPTTKVVVGGRSAIASLIAAFEADSALTWDEQVVGVADAPDERQLAAAATAVLNVTRGTKLRTSSDRAGWAGAVAVLSDDASAQVRAAVEEIAAG